MQPQYLAIAGLVADILGSFALSWGLVMSKGQAIKLGTGYVVDGDSPDVENIPTVRDRIHQSMGSVLGLSLLLIGFCLQLSSYLLPRSSESQATPRELPSSDLAKLITRDVAPSRPYHKSVDGTLYNVGRFSVTIIEPADSLRTWKILRAKGYPPS